jgi:hypothetical protein
MKGAQLKAKFGEELTLHGGIDLHHPDTANPDRLQRKLETLGSGGGYIFGLTSSLLDPSQLDHFLRVLAIAKHLKM